MRITPEAKFNNAHLRIAQAAYATKGVTPEMLLKRFYKTSKQPVKKIAGLTKKLRYMVRHGWMVDRAGIYLLTSAGRIKAQSFYKTLYPDNEPAPFMRLAK